MKKNNSILKYKIIKFIKDKKGSDDKNAGSAMSIVFSIIIGGLIITSVYNFFNQIFLPTVFDKIMEMFSMTR